MGRYYISQKVNPGSVANPANFQTLFFFSKYAADPPLLLAFLLGFQDMAISDVFYCDGYKFAS